MVNVLSVSTGADVAGIGRALATAFQGHRTVQLRSTVARSNYIAYPPDLPWSQVRDAYRLADVVHLHQSMKPWRLYGPKPFVLHHHGTRYRQHPDLFNRAVHERGGVAVVSTLDLLDYGPGLTWIPHPADLPSLARHRQPHHAGKLRVGHAPTSRTIKDTDLFLAACRKLDVEPVLIERHTWTDCLQMKGTVDVLYDQLQLGYGVNAIEAWGMGIPVIAGATPTILTRMRDTFDRVPFMEATRATLADAIAAMTDETIREQYATLGRDHATRWHNGAETVARLTGLYEQLQH